MDIKDKTAVVTADEYNELLQKLKADEIEKNKLARELRNTVKRYEILKLNFETQSNLTKTITTEKLKQEMYVKLLLRSCPEIIFVFDENMKFLLGTNSIADIINVNDISLLQGRELESIVANSFQSQRLSFLLLFESL
jgi:transcriptional regulator with PAS, ATPase and Fis domain